MRDNATEVLEGVGTAVVEVCVILDDLPSGGLDCNITAELATIDITAGTYGVLLAKDCLLRSRSRNVSVYSYTGLCSPDFS